MMPILNATVTKGSMLRKLGTFERALFLSDQHAPFNVVSVLRLEHPPAPDIIYRTLGLLQKRHPFLQARIKDGTYERLFDSALPFQVIEQQENIDWLKIVEHEMNTRLNPEGGLFRGSYLYNARHADLVLTFHHSIMDSASIVHLLDELLQICAGTLFADEITQLPPLEVVPPVEEQFPPSFKGLPGSIKIMTYALTQMADEIRYQWQMRGKRTPPVHLGARGFPLTLTIPEFLVDALSKRCREHKVTLNSLLNTSLLLAANRYLYEGRLTPMRTFTFADLRPYTVPPTSPEHLANYISMLRYTIDVSGESDIWRLTGTLHNKIYRSLKQGDKFTASKMSESLIRMFVGLKSMRMASTALNYSGALPLKKQYGGIIVKALHGFLSGFDLGPEVPAQARLFNNELLMDFMFLESDTDRRLAEKIVRDVQAILEKASTG
jgi:NRPS condensation-like uncharacterized protein